MRYKTAEAFRTALETRLGSMAAGSGPVLLRLRRIVAFERLLARIQAEGDSLWLLKGGFALQLRLGAKARTTRDVDLTADLNVFAGEASPQRLGEILAESASRNLDDHFVYRLSAGEALPIDAGPVRAYRFSVEAQLAKRRFESFHLDAGIGDPLVAPAVELSSAGYLDFAELPAVRFRAVSPQQHFAEKIHALTRPRGERENTRVHDLADLMLLLDLGLLGAQDVRKVITAIFSVYRKQPVPVEIADPPASWTPKYAAFATEMGLAQKDLAEAMTRLRRYWKELEWQNG